MEARDKHSEKKPGETSRAETLLDTIINKLGDFDDVEKEY